MNSKLGDFVPPLVAGSLVTVAAIATLLPLLLVLAGVIRVAKPKSEPIESRRPTVSEPETTTSPADVRRSNQVPCFGDRKETNT